MSADAGDQCGFVLVHGGVHTGRCWSRLLPHLTRPAIAVDLPGRNADPADLVSITVDDWVSSLVDEIAATPFGRVVLVGHSLAGIVLPGAAARIPERLAHLVFVSCSIPAEGKAIADTIPPGLRAYLHRRFRGGAPVSLPAGIAKRMFCNGMDPAATAEVLGQLCAEPPEVFRHAVSRKDLPGDIARTYVMLLRDRALPVSNQRRQIAHLGSCDVLAVDAPHDAFVSHPRPLAAILNGVADGAARRGRA